jgi:hypothetical protein
MISVTGQTFEYILQPALLTMHRETQSWLSAAELWKRELTFFQKILEQHSLSHTNPDFKKEVDHYQHLITYYQGEVVDLLRKKLHTHEKKLATILQQKNEADTSYFREHGPLMDELQTFATAFSAFKHNFFNFIERGFSPYK